MTDNVKKAVNKAHRLDAASQDLRASAKKKWNRAIVLCCVAFLILLSIGVAGIFYQNHYALESKNHIDCIIKDLSTPLPAGAKSRVIDYQTRLNADCKIKFN